MNLRQPEALLALLLDRYPRGVERDESAAAVWQALEERGYALHRAGNGFRLDGAGWFHPGRFAKRQRGGLGETLHTWGVTGSTNALAQQADAASAAPGTVWVADEQTSGRGRQGRHWLAPRHQGLLFSVRLAVDLHPDTSPQVLPLALGVALCVALEDVSGLPLQVKWPNDLICEGRKLGGLLLESSGSPEPRTILGVGINVTLGSTALQAHGVPDATGLVDAPRCAAACRRAGFREDLLARLLQAIESQVDVWRRGDTPFLLEAWRQRDALCGRRVRAARPGCVVEGDARGIDEHGRLLVADSQGTVHHFTSVEVHLL